MALTFLLHFARKYPAPRSRGVPMDDPTMTPRPLGDLSLNPSRAKATSFRRTLCVAQAALKESRWRSGNGAHGRSARPDPLQAFLRHWARTSSLRLRVSLLSSSAVSWRACSCFDRRARPWFSSSWLLGSCAALSVCPCRRTTLVPQKA